MHCVCSVGVGTKIQRAQLTQDCPLPSVLNSRKARLIHRYTLARAGTWVPGTGSRSLQSTFPLTRPGDVTISYSSASGHSGSAFSHDKNPCFLCFVLPTTELHSFQYAGDSLAFHVHIRSLYYQGMSGMLFLEFKEVYKFLCIIAWSSNICKPVRLSRVAMRMPEL